MHNIKRNLFAAAALLLLVGTGLGHNVCRAEAPASESPAAAGDGQADGQDNSPAATAATEPAATLTLEQRMAALEAELAAVKAEAAAAAACCPKPEEVDPCAEPDKPIETSIYGNVYLQWRNRRTSFLEDEDERFSDIDVYWGELGVNASYEDWSGRFSVLLDDSSEDVILNEAWARYQHKDDCGTDPWFFQVGKVLVPFGNNTYYFPTYPAVNDLGYSTLHAIGGGYDTPSSTFSAYAYNSRAELADSDNTIGDYTAVWDIARQTADDCRDGYELTVGYNSNLAAHDIRIAAEDTIQSRVPALNLFGRYDFNSNGKLTHILADYTSALDEFDPLDLDADGDGLGDRPAALNTELVYEPETDTLYGVSYQITDQFADYAEERWGLLYGVRLNKLAKFKLEYTHGTFGEYATAGQDKEDTLVAEINLAF